MLGYSIREAQRLMDNAEKACKEYHAPILHNVLEDRYVQSLSYGGKSTGSGGEGVVILICKDQNAQNQLGEYMKRKFNMESMPFCIKNRKK